MSGITFQYLSQIYFSQKYNKIVCLLQNSNKFRELATEIKEETYILEDEDEEGEGRTGNYCITIKHDEGPKC